ncbi:MAG: hypothetical protein ACI4DS_07685, partial [Eubacterium sp.]
ELSNYEHRVKTDYNINSYNDNSIVYEVNIEYPKDINDCFLRIDFGGDIARLYINGNICDDYYYTGIPWEIGMKRFDFPKKIFVQITPLQEDSDIFLETWPEFDKGSACKINKIEAVAEYKNVFGR